MLDNLNKQQRFLGEKETVALDQPYPEDETISYPQGWKPLDSTGKRARGRPRETSRRSAEKEMRVDGIS